MNFDGFGADYLSPFSREGRGRLFGNAAEDPQFLTPEIAQQNREAALQSANAKNTALDLYNKEQGDINAEITRNNNVNPVEQAQQEIARRQAALGIGNENLNRGINRNIAKMNLGSSAAGQFARANQERNFNNQTAMNQGNGYGLQNQFFDEQARRRAALTGQMNGIVSGADLPGIQYMNQGRQGTQGIAGGLIQGLGGIFGARAGKNYAGNS